MRISSATESDGCVSFNWIAACRGRSFHGSPLWRKRATTSWSEQLTRKYSWRKRSVRPAAVESSGYRTRVSDSASTLSMTAPTKSPCENSAKSNVSGAAAAHSRSVLAQGAPYPTMGRSYAMPSSVVGRFGSMWIDEPSNSIEALSATRYVRPGRTISQGSGRRSQWSGCSTWYPSRMDWRKIPYS